MFTATSLNTSGCWRLWVDEEIILEVPFDASVLSLPFITPSFNLCLSSSHTNPHILSSFRCYLSLSPSLADSLPFSFSWWPVMNGDDSLSDDSFCGPAGCRVVWERGRERWMSLEMMRDSGSSGQSRFTAQSLYCTKASLLDRYLSDGVTANSKQAIGTASTATRTSETSSHSHPAEGWRD